MENAEETRPHRPMIHMRTLAGILLLAAGCVLFLDQYLKTVWLTLFILPAAGLFLYLYGVWLHHYGLLITGGVITGIGAGIMAAFNPGYPQNNLFIQIGYVLSFFAAGWLAVIGGTAIFARRPAWWALIPFGVIGGIGGCILTTPFRWVDIVLYTGMGIGVPLLIWGLAEHLFGLVIPGSLVSVIGPGIYMAWGVQQQPNGLAQTGIMLVWFSLGWAMITAFSRVMYNQYAWWPLIPGGILAVVGFGLYIGGEPKNALAFISNTGSVALMIFGLYLLLMRKGIHH